MFRTALILAASTASVAFAQSSGLIFEREDAPVTAPVRRPAPLPTPAVAPARPAPATVPTQAVQATVPVVQANVQRQPTLAERFQCAQGNYTDSTADATQLFREVLEVEGMRPGRFIVEDTGNGNVVKLKIMPSRTIQLDVVSHGGQIGGRLCVRTHRGRQHLEMQANHSEHGGFTITITNPEGRRNRLHMVGSGRTRAFLNYSYTVQASAESTR